MPESMMPPDAEGQAGGDARWPSSGSLMARARSTMLAPPIGLNEPADRIAVLAAVDRPVDAELDGLVGRHLDDDRLDQHLRAADVELVDDRHQRPHHLGRRGDDQGVGLGSAQIVMFLSTCAAGSGAAAPAARALGRGSGDRSPAP